MAKGQLGARIEGVVLELSLTHPTIAVCAVHQNAIRFVDVSVRGTVLQKKMLSRTEQGAGSEWAPNPREWVVMITLAVSSVAVALDATILVSVIPTLARSLHGNTTISFWVGTSYLLTSAVVQPLVTAIAHVFGYRYPLLSSLGFFTVGSIICGVAPSFAALLAGRVVQGGGGGGIITLSQVVYGAIVPLRQRPRYFSMVQGAWAAGTLLGPMVGAALVQRASWRWCFYVNLPICVIAFLMATQTSDLHVDRRAFREKLGLVDWTGLALFVASLTAALVAISQGGQAWAWSSPPTLGLLLGGLAGVVLTILYEVLLAAHPFLVHEIFPNRSAVQSHLAALSQGAVLFMALYYLCFYFAAAQLASPLGSGVDLLPAVAFSLPGSIIVSLLITRWGRYRWAVWGGWTVTALGCGLLIRFDHQTPKGTEAPVLRLLGAGFGMNLSAGNCATQAAMVDPARSGQAAAMYAFIRTLGMTMGVALGGTVFQNQMRWKLRALGLPENIADNAEAFAHGAWTNLPDIDPVRVNVLASYVRGFRAVFIAMTVISVSTLLATASIKHYSLETGVESGSGHDEGEMRPTSDLPSTCPERVSVQDGTP